MAFKLYHSQNYLHNPNLVEYLIQKTSINNKDLIVEIGPGKGIITALLSPKCFEVHSIEKDTNLALQLRNKFNRYSNIKIILGDFLEYPLPREKYKVFSNIPFTITADIVKKILTSSNPPEDTYLIMQQEAVSKFAGQPYGAQTLTSILYNPTYSFEVLHVFKPSDFTPMPKVTAVLLRILKRPHSLIESGELKLYKDFVTYGFTHKPGLKRSFEEIFGIKEFKILANDLCFSMNATQTDLVLEQWLKMFNYFIVHVSKEKQSKVEGSFKRLLLQQEKLEKVHRTR